MSQFVPRAWAPLLVASTLLGGAVLLLRPRADGAAQAGPQPLRQPSPGAADPLAQAEGEPAQADFASTGAALASPRLAGSRASSARRVTGVARYPRRSIEQLRQARGWIEFLRTWHGLPAAPTPQSRAERLRGALADLEDPVVRQNVIFAVALMLPWEEARPWLVALRASGSGADAEDALCALAFSGDPASRAELEALARSASNVSVQRLVDDVEAHDSIAAQGTPEARDVLRSYRSIEALDRSPYFHMVPFLVTHSWSRDGSQALLAMQPGQPLAVGAREALLRAWLARYPGHPGTDSIALRMARLRLEAQDRVGATQWFARALGGPDQDRASRSEAPLVALSERLLTTAELGWLSEAEGLDTPSRNLYRYARLRRVAVEIGFAKACQEAESLAAQAFPSLLAEAWSARHEAPPPRGLASGLVPLLPSDPLLAVHGRPGPSRLPAYGGTNPLGVRWKGWAPEERLHPAPDPWAFEPQRLRGQLRAWEALAELERRTENARGIAQADLLYKQAAVLYHDRDVLFPCYASHSSTFRQALSSLDREDGLPQDEGGAAPSLEHYESCAFAWERAIALFQRIEREHPDYPAMDKVIFSQGMCCKRLVDYRPRGAWSLSWRSPFHAERDDPAAQAIRRCVELFERVAHEHARSPLADDAARAAAWWRRERPQAFAAPTPGADE